MVSDVREQAARPADQAAAARAPVPWPAAAQATLHCLIGCAIGEVLGMVLATWCMGNSSSSAEAMNCFFSL